MSVDGINRLERIRAALEADGSVRVADLAAQLGVSEMTVRRDLDALADRGVVQRVRGGALALGPQPFAERYGQQARAKDVLAGKLLPLVGEGGAIGLDASTTLQRLAARLTEARDLTVLTNSLESFAVLGSHPGVTALATGGQLDPRTGSLVGPMASRAAADISLRRLFLSAAGLDPEVGSTESTLEEAEVKRALAQGAASVVLAIDSTKLDRRGAAHCLDLERIDVLVTDLDPGDPRLDPYRSGCEVR